MNTLNKIRNLNKFIVIIPARSGSKRIKNKNLRICGGKKLIFWTLDILRNTIGFENSYVSTDSDKIINYCIKEGFKNFIIRSKKYSEDSTSMLETLKFTIKKISKLDKKIYSKNIILLQPTSPIRKKSDIINSIIMFNQNNADSLVSTYNLSEEISNIKLMEYTKNKKFIKNFDTKKNIYIRNGPSILITKVKNIISNNLYGKNILNFEMPLSRSIDINTIEDLNDASKILKIIKEK
tara:strand:- start:224 stop:934 length:711 start_codon:yes stop_codon:yes gene_type:complete